MMERYLLGLIRQLGIIGFIFFSASSAFAISSSSNYQFPSGDFNHGSGSGFSENYQISRGIISRQPIGNAGSSTYDLHTDILDDDSTGMPSCSLLINGGGKLTKNPLVNLGLICSDSNGCNKMALSNNGVSFTDELDYTLTTTWQLTANDGEKRVFVKFKDGTTPGNWSGVCSASIVLDTTAPTVSASPVGGTFMAAQSVTLTASEPGTIYYTTDGSDPTTSGTRQTYSGVISITANDNDLKAYAVDTAGNPGAVMATQHYTICNGGNFTITGKVLDASTNTPIQYAKVKWPNSSEQVTGADGLYTVTGLPKGYYNLEYVKLQNTGYVTYQKQLTLCNTPTTITNDIPLTRNASVFGSNTQSGYSWGSVNTSTGNYVYSKTDLSLPGIGISFAFERAYNSQDTSTGPLGYGWNHTYNITLTESSGYVTVRWGDGKIEQWGPDGSGGYTPLTGVFSKLTKTGGLFTVNLKNMTSYNFDATNKLASIVDENGNIMAFTYSGGSLANITDTVGRVISVSYDGSNRITRVLDPIGRSAIFNYDVNGDLVSAIDLAGNTTAYTYDSNHLLLTITDPKGNISLTNTYDTTRYVVTSQKDALGAETLYSYDVANRVTQIIDPFGNSSYHQFDDLMRMTKETDARGNSAIYAYTARGSLESVKDKNGNVTSYEYDSNDNIDIKTEPEGKISGAVYDTNNNPTTKCDANGYGIPCLYSTGYAYSNDGKGNLLTITDPYSKVTTFTYDSLGQIKSKTDAKGGVTTNWYDVYGNLVQMLDAGGNIHTFQYDLVGRKTAEFHPDGRAMSYEYDNKDRLLSATDASGGTTTFKYDANGNKTEAVDALNNKTTFTYDAKNRLIATTTPLSETVTYTYDEMDRRVVVKNAKNAVTNFVYDATGNLIRTIDALGNQVQQEYDANGNRTKATDAMGNITTFVYDGLNRMTSRTDSLGHVESYSYDKNGNRLTVTLDGKTTSFTYDYMNRLLTVKDPLNNITTNQYDELGRLKSVTDARGNQTQFEYDAMGRMTKVTDAEGGIVTAIYDANGNRLSVTDTRGTTTTYTYDILNRLTSETMPVTGTTSMAKSMFYDKVGNLISLIDSSDTASYTYDADNRVLTVTRPDMAVAYTYDANGNRISVADTDVYGPRTTTYSYDELDRVSSITDPFGMTVGYTYDPNGKRTSTKYPGNRPVFYYYDDLNRLTRVEDWGGVSTTYQYDNAGRLTGQTMGNGSTVAYTYDNAGRLTDKLDKTAGNTVIASYHYDLDANGNRTGMIMNQPLVPRPDYTDTTFTHNDGNQVVSGGGNNYTYDGKGNRITRNDGTVTTQYGYNYQNRLTQVTSGANTDEYGYSSDGKRLKTIKNGVETRYLLDLNGGMENVIAEMNTSNAVSRYYIYGDGLLYSIDGTTGERLYYHYDPLGSTVAIADSTGNVTDKYAYLPFGELNKSELLHDNPFTYVGKFGVMQEGNGLYFMRARFYDPETRRFMSVDPVKGAMGDTQSWGTYGYAMGNPLLLIDPTGLSGTYTDYCGSKEFNAPDYVWGVDKNKHIWVVDMNHACKLHDLCYGTFGSSKPQCDKELREDIQRDNNYSDASITISKLYYKAVASPVGDIAYSRAQTEAKAFKDEVDEFDKSIKAWGDQINSVTISDEKVIGNNNGGGNSDRSAVALTKNPPPSSPKACPAPPCNFKDFSPLPKKDSVATILKNRWIAETGQKISQADWEDARQARLHKKYAEMQKAEEERQKRLYEEYMISISKYPVLIQDMVKGPTFVGGFRQGVYGK